MVERQCNNRTSGKTPGYGGHARTHGRCVGVVCDETRTVCREADTACDRRSCLAESAAGQLLQGIPKFRADMARKLH
jgi:hypothetical protein